MADKARTDSRQAQNQLIQRVANLQDRHAFMLLFGYFGPRVKGYFLRSGAQNVQAEDLTQAVMLTVWRRAQTFDPARTNVSTWIFTIARNARIDALKHEKLAANAQQQVLGPDALIDQFGPLDHPLDAGERASRLRVALYGLSAEQFDLVRLSYFEGRSLTDIARSLNASLTTIKARLRRSTVLLREILEDLR